MVVYMDPLGSFLNRHELKDVGARMRLPKPMGGD